MSKHQVLAKAIQELHPGIDLGQLPTRVTDAPTTEAAICAWREWRWPKPGGPEAADTWDALKVTGEAGEVAEAVTKIAEGRKDEQALANEIGDVLVALSVLAGRHGWTLDELRSARWADVRRR